MGKADDKPTPKSLLDLPESAEPPPTPEQSAEMLRRFFLNPLADFTRRVVQQEQERRRRLLESVEGLFPAPPMPLVEPADTEQQSPTKREPAFPDTQPQPAVQETPRPKLTGKAWVPVAFERRAAELGPHVMDITAAARALSDESKTAPDCAPEQSAEMLRRFFLNPLADFTRRVVQQEQERRRRLLESVEGLFPAPPMPLVEPADTEQQSPTKREPAFPDTQPQPAVQEAPRPKLTGKAWVPVAFERRAAELGPHVMDITAAARALSDESKTAPDCAKPLSEGYCRNLLRDLNVWTKKLRRSP